LGNIGEQKGVALIAAMSRLFKRDQRDMRLVVLGTIDPRFTIAKPSLVHGAYRIEDLPELIERFGISKWLIPSIWPETFSYTTHECLATGLPTFVFDLGAQAEAARQAPNGHLLRLPRRKVPAEALAARVLAKITAPPRPDLPLVTNRQGFEVEGAEPRGAD
ncbi:MAG: glycosyltransferase, partial [Pseudomonadota bacterium]